MMHNRLRLLRLATGLLYFGPLLAGLIGQGWAMVPVFVVIFLLWSIILRPHLWPSSAGDLTRSEAWVAVATLVITQILLVVVLFAIGRGIGGVLALKPVMSGYLPAAISFLSVPLSRIIWNPRVAAENVGFDPVVHDLSPNDPTQTVDPEGVAAAMLAQMMALPDDVSEDEVHQHLVAISSHVDPALIRKGLGDVVAGGKASAAGVKALIVQATDPAFSNLFAGSSYPAQAFAAAGRDAGLLTLFARRFQLVLADEPDLAADCPSAGTLRAAAVAISDPVAEAELHRLAGLLDQIRPSEQSVH